MELLEKQSFIASIPPFDSIKEKKLTTLINNLDIAYFKQNEVIISSDIVPQYLYFIIKGAVYEFDDDEVIDVYHEKQFFGAYALIREHARHRFLATSECICYILPRDVFLSLVYKSKKLETYFFQSIAEKLSGHTKNERQKDILTIMTAKVRDAFLHKPITIDEHTSIYDGIVAWGKDKDNSLLVHSPSGELGIVTNTDIREKAILQKKSFDEPLHTIANYNLHYINHDEFLFNAQITMHKNNIKKLIVQNKDLKIIGLLDMTSMMSFFSSHTYTIDLEIEKASSIEELQKASLQMTNTIKLLFAKGIKVRHISQLISGLNDKLFIRLFELTAPTAIKDKCSIIVMGSEGREEQILKTDQDNAIILSDDCVIDEKELSDFTAQFTQNLCDFGYELCPGNIMLSNPYWCKTVSEFKELLSMLIKRRSNDDLLQLAIFYDSKHVVGDENFIKELKMHLYEQIHNSNSFYESFSKNALSFATPLSMFDNLVLDKKEHKNELDLKKGAIFPIVHGIRSLAMEKKIKATNTTTRLKELQKLQVFSDDLGNELIEAFDFLLSLRLKERLRKIKTKKELNNYINPNSLGVLERDLLIDSFKIVNKFKKFISAHFHLNLLG